MAGPPRRIPRAPRTARIATPRRIAPAATRIERDSIGEVLVPRHALYGIQTVRAMQNLAFSGRALGDYPDYVRALAIVKQAAARANRDAGVLDRRLSGEIDRACDALTGGEHLEQFPVDVLGGGGSIAINMNINEVLANLSNEHLGQMRGSYVPVHPKNHVNASQSTADICHTAIRIAILERWEGLRRALDGCVAAYRVKARELRKVITISRTCLQDAAPTSLGELFGGHGAAIERRADELRRRVESLRQINIGGTAIGDGGGAPAAYRRAVLARLNEITGRKLAMRRNLYDAAQNPDDLAAVAAELAMLAEVFIKIAQDLRLLSSGPNGGLGEIVLPAVQEGSSFFPGKINPVIPETLLQCCFQVLGCERAARLVLERGELNLNVFEGAAAINVLDAIEMMRAAITLFVTRCLAGVAANEVRCRALAAQSRYQS
jgi:aspartate ammonia-lyase